MGGDPIPQLLTGQWPDPETGQPLGVPVRSIVIAESLSGIEADLVARLDLGRRLAVVSDPATYDVLGARVEQALASVGQPIPIRLRDHPHADDITVDRIREATADADALLAVGSGTINDLCKYAAFQDGKPYAVFGTAPSMNGSATACAGRRPQADWLLSRLLRDTPYHEAPFALLVGDESALFTRAAALLDGDLEAMRRLARTLVLSGLGMCLCGGSYPASQGEHLISHYIEMMGGPNLPASFHGEQIGVTTLTMARLQERVLDAVPVVRPTVVDAGAACTCELAAKALSPAAAEALSYRLSRSWPAIRERIAAVRHSAADLQRTLAAAGAPTRPSELGWRAPFYRSAVTRTRQIRNRYSFLDAGCASPPGRRRTSNPAAGRTGVSGAPGAPSAGPIAGSDRRGRAAGPAGERGSDPRKSR